MSDSEDFDSLVKRVDHDRWLSSRFVADQALRADLIALYAFDHELARVAARVSNPMLGEIRLAWWGEALDEAYGGRTVRAHPTAEALADVVRRRDLPRAPLDRMIEGRAADLSAEPFADEGELAAHLDAAYGGAADAACALLAPGTRAPVGVGRAWGLANLRRPPPFDPATLSARIAAEVRSARREAGRLPASAFPAVAHAALAPWRASERPVSDGAKRLRLTLAVATGRL